MHRIRAQCVLKISKEVKVISKFRSHLALECNCTIRHTFLSQFFLQMFCKKAPEKPCCLAAFSPHLDKMVVVMVILVCLSYLSTLVDVGDEYLHDSVMFTKSVMLQPRSMASQTMKAAESPNTTYKVARIFFTIIWAPKKRVISKAHWFQNAGLVTVECIEASVCGSAWMSHE